MNKLIAVAAVLSLCACGREDVSASLTTKMDAWGKAFNAHDVSALLTDYADDAQFIYAFEGQEGRGRDALKAFYTQTFTMIPDFAVQRTSLEVVEVSDGIAMSLGEYSDTFTGPDGKVTAPTHASEVWVRKNGTWQILVDHASFVPPPM